MLEITKSYTFKTAEREDIIFAEGKNGSVILRFEDEEGTLSYDQVVRLRSVILYDLASEPAKEQVQAVAAAAPPPDVAAAPAPELVAEPIKDDEIPF